MNEMPRALTAEDAEVAVLGSVIIDPTCLALVRPLLPEPVMFFQPDHRDVWAALLKLADTNQPLDFVGLGRLLDGRLMGRLSDLMDAAGRAEHVTGHAGLVRDAYARRLVHQEAHRLVGLTGDPRVPLTESVGAAIGALSRYAAGLTGPGTRVGYVTSLGNVMEAVEREGDFAAMAGLGTGLEPLDEILDGLQPGLHVVAGNPGEGKTALGLLFARTAADAGPVLLDSLEMTPDQLVHRLLTAEAGVGLKWAMGDAARRERYAPTILRAAGILAGLPVEIEPRGTTPAHLRLCWQAAIAQGKAPRLVVVDYLQLMKPDTKEATRDREMGEITRALKLMSGEFDVPVVLLSQLSRESARMRRPPELYDLRDSGNIEQDADTVTMLHYPNGRPETGPASVDLYVRKNRGGALGKIPLLFEGWTQRWKLAGRQEEAA
jgi:replicative DNA helicase